LRIGYAGALAPHKGVHTLLEALARLNWFKTTVRIAAAAESGRHVDELRRLARGLRVEFVGRVPPDAMPTFLDDLDILVVPSLWPENVPMAVLEAFSRNKTVIASNMPGIAELIEDDTLLFEPGSADGLARALQNWLDRKEPPAIPRVRRAEEMAADTLAVYAEVLRR
jgi:glycosyltransferase involved in cell wall biosynthesis